MNTHKHSLFALIDRDGLSYKTVFLSILVGSAVAISLKGLGLGLGANSPMASWVLAL